MVCLVLLTLLTLLLRLLPLTLTVRLVLAIAVMLGFVCALTVREDAAFRTAFCARGQIAYIEYNIDITVDIRIFTPILCPSRNKVNSIAVFLEIL